MVKELKLHTVQCAVQLYALTALFVGKLHFITLG